MTIDKDSNAFKEFSSEFKTKLNSVLLNKLTEVKKQVASGMVGENYVNEAKYSDEELIDALFTSADYSGDLNVFVLTDKSEFEQYVNKIKSKIKNGNIKIKDKVDSSISGPITWKDVLELIDKKGFNKLKNVINSISDSYHYDDDL